MPFDRFYNLPDAKRAQLIGVAKAEFAAHGYEQASFNRIVRDAGVSKGAMYYYFADKNDLFNTVIEGEMDRLEQALPALAPPTDEAAFWAGLVELCYRATELLMADPGMADMGRALYASTTGGQGQALEKVQQRAMKWVEHALQLGQSVGAIRDDLPRELLASMVTGLLLGADRWFAEHWSHFDGQAAQAKALEEKLLEMCRNFLRPSTQPTTENSHA